MSTRNSSIPTKKYRLILSAVHMVYRLVNSTYNVQELAVRLTRLLCQFIKASSAIICLLDEHKKTIVLKVVFDNKKNTIVQKRQALEHISEKEKKVTQGYEIFEKHLIAMPLVADDNVGAIIIRRDKNEAPFNEFDKEMLSIVAEQSVTAIKKLQLYEKQQRTILGSLEFIKKLLGHYRHGIPMMHTPVYFKIAKSLAEKLQMGQDGIESLYYACVLHDAGAIDVPFEILSKTSRLSSEEFKIIRDHPAKNFELIKPMEFLKPVLPIILYHHEKYDGTGYPSGLKKEQIPVGARIMAFVDAFEAMVMDRPYRKKRTLEEAIEELKRNSGTQFDPSVVIAFVELCKQKKFRNYLSCAIQ